MKTLTILLTNGIAAGFSICDDGKRLEAKKDGRIYRVDVELSKSLGERKEPLTTRVTERYRKAAREMLQHLSEMGFEDGNSSLYGEDVAYVRPTEADGVKLLLRNGEIVEEKHTWFQETVPKEWVAWAKGVKEMSKKELKNILRTEFSLTEREISLLFSVVGKSESHARKVIRGIRPIESGVALEDDPERKSVVVNVNGKPHFVAKHTFSTLRRAEAARKKLSRYANNVIVVPELDPVRKRIVEFARIRQVVGGKISTTELPISGTIAVLAAGRISKKKLRELLSEMGLEKEEVENVVGYLEGKAKLSLPFSGYKVFFHAF